MGERPFPPLFGGGLEEDRSSREPRRGMGCKLDLLLYPGSGKMVSTQFWLLSEQGGGWAGRMVCLGPKQNLSLLLFLQLSSS